MFLLLIFISNLTCTLLINQLLLTCSLDQDTLQGEFEKYAVCKQGRHFVTGDDKILQHQTNLAIDVQGFAKLPHNHQPKKNNLLHNCMIASILTYNNYLYKLVTF